MTSANVPGSWKATYPLNDEGLLTEAEGRTTRLIDSRSSVLHCVGSRGCILGSGTRPLKRRYEDFAMVNTADVVWGWAATEEELDVMRLFRGGGIGAG